MLMRHAALFLALVAPAHGDKCAWIEPPPPSPPKPSSQCSIGGMTQCCAHSDCAAQNQYCFDTGYFQTPPSLRTDASWNGIGQCSNNPPDCCASGDADPIDRDPSQCPAVSGCSSGRRLGDKILSKTSAMAMLGTLTKIISMPDVVRMNDVTRAASDDDIAKHLITQPGHSVRMLQSSNRVCALENINTGSCGGLFQEADGCWEEYTWTFLSTTSTGQVCCAESTGDCCEINPGALAGAIIGVIVVLGLAVLSCVACCLFKCCSCCPCNKHNPSKRAVQPT
jgi:hypothetical protein